MQRVHFWNHNILFESMHMMYAVFVNECIICLFVFLFNAFLYTDRGKSVKFVFADSLITLNIAAYICK